MEFLDSFYQYESIIINIVNPNYIIQINYYTEFYNYYYRLCKTILIILGHLGKFYRKGTEDCWLNAIIIFVRKMTGYHVYLTTSSLSPSLPQSPGLYLL